MAKKADLIKTLVEDYGYEKEDLKNDGKLFTNGELEALIKKEEEDAQAFETQKNRVVAKTQTIKDEDKILVMSGSLGTVVYRSDISRRVWKFTNFGQTEAMPYGELVTIRNRYPSYFTEGWLVILDAQVQDEFNLTVLYENILTPENIDTVFEKPIDELSAMVRNLPEGMKNTFVNRAQDLYKIGKIESMKVVKLIEEQFGFKLEDNSPVSDFALEGSLDRNNVIYVDKR